MCPPDLFLRCWMLPRHLNRPFTMMPSRVHKASHSSMLQKTAGECVIDPYGDRGQNSRETSHLCDVSTTDRPVLMMSRIKFQRNRRAFGSMPVVGSSCNNPPKTHSQMLKSRWWVQRLQLVWSVTACHWSCALQGVLPGR